MSATMLGIHDYGLFVLAAILLNIAPGQDTLYILSRSIGQGRRIGVASALGVSAGTVVHTFAAALGLSAVLATSATAFLVVKWAGAAYLVYLGVRALWKPAMVVATQVVDGADTRKAFRQGLLTNVLNPKVALFFLAFLPQFVDADAPARTMAFVLLGLTFVTTGTLWVLVLAVGAAQVRGFFERRPRAQAWISRAMGGVFVFLGVRLAISER
jgi:threonine/homoserine/homoserine lactone efflux protein